MVSTTWITWFPSQSIYTKSSWSFVTKLLSGISIVCAIITSSNTTESRLLTNKSIVFSYEPWIFTNISQL
jgi:hypothetical protein